MFVEIAKKKIDVNKILKKVKSPKAGATAVFIGSVRNRNKGRRVDYIVYSAYEEMAKKELLKIAKNALRKFSLTDIAVAHRLGRLKVGEISVVIAVSSPHRKEAFDALRLAITEIKRSAPIWKKEGNKKEEWWVV